MKQTKNNTKLILTLTLSALIFTGCTQERPYDKLFKDPAKIEAKTSISQKEDYMMLITAGKVGRNAPRLIPFFAGKEKRVRLAINEKNISVYELENIEQFAQNELNEKPVLNIPIDHIDYKCAEDAYGDCTHKEEENKDIHWSEKKFFKVDFNKMEQISTETLPSTFANLGFKCLDAKDTRLVELKIEKDAINFTLERSYQTNIFCADFDYLFEFSNLSFKMQHHYSFAKLSTLVSQNYKAVNYSRDVERSFGFFKNTIRELSPDGTHTQDKEKFLMNRWNPNKPSVQFYLSEEFNKPKNAKLKAASYQSIATINQGLKKSGAQLRVQLNDYKPGIHPGDLRYNMIVLAEEPDKSGILGYGPSHKNPMTGEIFKANTIMYSGNLITGLKRTYNRIIREKRAQALAQGETPNIQDSPQKAAEQTAELRQSLLSQMADFTRKQVNKVKVAVTDVTEEDLKLKNLIEIAEEHNKHLDFLTKNQAYPSEFMNFASSSKEFIDKVVDKVGLKLWRDLTEAEKKEIVDAVIPYIYTRTFIHEIGHNLGLRHNFSGSEDKDNWYSESELKDLHHHQKAEYSTVMDYPFKNTNALNVLGKYDVAALKFAYAEKIEAQDGSDISLNDFIQNTETPIKQYQYCSDEGVAPNPNCNRHDEGTNLVEILQNKIQYLEEVYQRAFYRDGRLNFSLMDDPRLIGFTYRMYKSIRLHFERMESIHQRFNVPYNDPVWDSTEPNLAFLKDLKDSTLMAADYLISVVKTASPICAFAQKGTNQVSQLVPLSFFAGSTHVMDCFDESIVSNVERFNLVPVSEAGKSFISRKSPNNPNIYADQIDLRGIWFQKILATHFLFTRELGSVLFDGDGATDNFMALPQVKAKVDHLIEEIMFDEVTGELHFNKGPFSLPPLTVTYPLHQSHVIDNPMNRFARRMLSLPGRSTTFDEQFIKRINRLSISDLHSAEDNERRAHISVRTTLPESVRVGQKTPYKKIVLGGREYYAVKGINNLAYKAMETIDAIDLLSQATLDQINAIIEEMKAQGATSKLNLGVGVLNNTAAANASVALAEVQNAATTAQNGEKVENPGQGGIDPGLKNKIMKLPLEVLERYASFVMQDKEFYQKLILKLPWEN